MPELFLIASTDFPFEKTLTDIAYVNYIADPLEWLVLLRVPGLWRVLVPAPENSDRDKLLSDEHMQGMLQRVVPRPEPYEIAHRSIYHVHQRVAKKLPPRPRAARRRRRPRQQSARRHGHERRHPGRVQSRRQACRRSAPAPTTGCSTATTGSGAPSRSRRCSSRPTATSRSSASAIRRRGRNRSTRCARPRPIQSLGARIHAAVIDDRQHAAGGGDRVAPTTPRKRSRASACWHPRLGLQQSKAGSWLRDASLRRCSSG